MQLKNVCVRALLQLLLLVVRQQVFIMNIKFKSLGQLKQSRTQHNAAIMLLCFGLSSAATTQASKHTQVVLRT